MNYLTKLPFQSPAVMSGASSLRQAPDMTPGAGVSSGGGHVYAPCASPAPPSPAPPSAMSGGAPTSLLSAAGGATGHSMETAIVPQLQNIVSTVSLCVPLDLKKIALQVCKLSLWSYSCLVMSYDRLFLCTFLEDLVGPTLR